jgi:hypothetical protein
MTLSPGRRLLVTCDTPLDINGGGIIDAKTPTLVEAPKTERIFLYPVNKLGPGFAEGWHKLPYELKERVLEFNLVAPFAGIGVTRKSRYHLLPYLRMTKELATMAREMFYTKNIFALQLRNLDYYMSPRSYMYYPPATINSHIRHVRLYARLLEGTEQSGWSKIKDFASGIHEFPNLRYLEINLTVTVGGWSMRELQALEVLDIGCAGEVTLQKYWFGPRAGRFDHSWDAIQDMIRERLVFHPRATAT